MILIIIAQATGGEALVGALLLGVFGIMLLITVFKGLSHDSHVEDYDQYIDVKIKGGAPYCPRCNRQVSYRRDVCRCCGYAFVTYKPKVQPDIDRQSTVDLKRKSRKQWQENERLRKEADEKACLEKLQRKKQDKERKEKLYLKRGITPGPMAPMQSFKMDCVEWYKSASDAAQMFVLTMAIAIPGGLMTYVFFRLSMPRP